MKTKQRKCFFVYDQKSMNGNRKFYRMKEDCRLCDCYTWDVLAATDFADSFGQWGSPDLPDKDGKFVWYSVETNFEEIEKPEFTRYFEAIVGDEVMAVTLSQYGSDKNLDKIERCFGPMLEWGEISKEQFNSWKIKPWKTPISTKRWDYNEIWSYLAKWDT